MALEQIRRVRERLAPPAGFDASEYDKCRSDVCYWVDNYVSTYDPRPEAAPNHLPFKLYRFQSEHLRFLDQQYSGNADSFTEKSRDMGVSWLTLAWMLHHWLFDDSFQGLIGSRKEDLVDNWQMDSLFGKLAYIVDRLPAWMLPKRWTAKCRQYMKLVNPDNGNAIIGESANQNFSRQGRYSTMLLDEFAFWPWARSVWTASADASPCRIVVTTPEPGSFAKELRQGGKIAVRSLHWTLHPHKDQAWYEQEKLRRTDEDVAKELDINWSGSLRGLVYPGWQQIRKGDYPYQHGWPLYVSWDFGIADETALIWLQQNPATRLWRIIDCFSASSKTIDWYVPFVTGDIVSLLPGMYDERTLSQIDSHRGWAGAIHYGDPAGSQRNEVTGTSVIDELRKHGIYIQTRTDMNTFEARYTATQLFLRRVEGVNTPACNLLDDSMGNARFPERREGSQATTEITKPIHDWTSHFRTSLEYMAVNEPRNLAARPEPPQRIRQSGDGGSKTKAKRLR